MAGELTMADPETGEPCREPTIPGEQAIDKPTSRNTEHTSISGKMN